VIPCFDFFEKQITIKISIMERFLTKSRFKLGLECETKLYYTRKKEYADQSIDDPFLIELAKGGYQVGELAKFYFTNNPQQITVKEKDYALALKDTQKRIDNRERYIAEAAIQYENLFIRVDIFEIDLLKKEICLYEVKSVSYKSDDQFLKKLQRGENKGKTVINNEWLTYLMDVAFQKYVVTKAFPDFNVNAFLMMINSNAVATVDGLNQFFKVKKDNGGYKVYYKKNLGREDLGDEILIKVPVDDVIEFIWNTPVQSAAFPNYIFENYIKALDDYYAKDLKINTPLSKECKNCQFYTKSSDLEKGLKSGVKECWVEKLKISENRFNNPRVTEIWGGKYGSVSIVQKLIDKKVYFLDQVKKEYIHQDLTDNFSGELNSNQRRWLQVSFTQSNEKFYLDRKGLKAEMDKWIYPLHFIDFETTSPALPFTKGAKPYEGVAFQYSHHIVYKTSNGGYEIEHKSQFLKADQFVNPNIDFIRQLKQDLSTDSGTIFRYHNHENTFLRFIYEQIKNNSEIQDKLELMNFIDSITNYKIDKEKIAGERNMVDMYDLVLRFYYSRHAKGSNSLKQILPAAINDSKFLQAKYSKPIYGKNKPIKSLNFNSQTWIDENFNNDPYKTLPPVFENFSREELDALILDMDGLADGGAAMMAYAKLQFFDIPEDQRDAIKTALLKYCELDTLAMVILWEFWNNEINNF
jgi:hypothetical protein